ncbi:hypothetical protein J3D55_003762 [Chryseobacterium ginsenosidimutans]|uniref:hypothetical protein n=1 Tax=Chryseobacterium ginsenosidimutans TaxID=687846 RepID=UPI00216A4861|nr:hypothetical protein [Chryseobacterium ginsenosidimutans]MCS3870846.1 hypothetical protein [Chryseobacterium ginsenosidimutans]
MENFKVTNLKTSETGSNPHYFNNNTSLKVLSIDNNTNSLINVTNCKNSNMLQYGIRIVSTGDYQSINKDHLKFHTNLNK